MFKATEAICEAFDEAELHYNVHDSEDSSAVIASISTKLTHYDMLFISNDDDNDVAVRVYRFVSFDESKTDEMIRLVNELNDDYRFLKFTADTSDSTITISYDIPVSCEDVGNAAVEILVKLMRNCDKFYPRIMKVLWAD